jgi:hypothetical protein
VSKNHPIMPSIIDKYMAIPFSGRLPKPITIKLFKLNMRGIFPPSFL